MNRKVAVLALLLVPIALAWAAQAPESMKELVAAERKFSATCGKIGIRDSFQMFFADDVITFGNTMRMGKEYLKNRPADWPNGPRLQWEPVYGDISKSGDLGYTTGPYTLTTTAGQNYYGIFFSLWKRQSDGQWKVILDAGVDTPKPAAPPAEFTIAPQFHPPARFLKYPESAQAAISRAEQHLAREARTKGLSAALLESAADGLRIHRANVFPLTGIKDARAYLKDHDSLYELRPLEVGVASSGDLGYAIGHYKNTFKSAPGSDSSNLETSGPDPKGGESSSPQDARKPASSADEGYYVRIWKIDSRSQWRLMVDSMIPTS